MRWLCGITDLMDMDLSKLQKTVEDREAWHAAACGSQGGGTIPPVALPSLGFSRQEHWSGLPFPSPMHEREK